MPERIQRRRTKGYRLPPNTIYVGRPTKWGNQFVVGWYNFVLKRNLTQQDCVDRYRNKIEANTMIGFNLSDIVTELKGKDLACWCPLTDKDGKPVPCHADVLLELANHA